MWHPFGGWGMPGMVPPRPAAPRGGGDLKTVLATNQDLNHSVDHLLSAEAMMELDEHLEDLIQQDTQAEAEDQIWMAALEEGTLPSSRSREHKSSGSKAASGGQGEDSENPSAGASASTNPSGTASSALPPAAEDDSSSDSEQEEAVGEDAPENAAEGATAKGSAASAPTRKVRTMLLSPAWRRGSLAALQAMRSKRLEEAGEKEILELQLGQIRYSQDSIRDQFRDSRHLKVMREQLTKGKDDRGRDFTVNEVPKISVVLRDGVAYSADNRRLWTFRHCGMTRNTRIPVIKKRTDDGFLKKLTTFTQGNSVARRGNKLHY